MWAHHWESWWAFVPPSHSWNQSKVPTVLEGQPWEWVAITMFVGMPTSGSARLLRSLSPKLHSVCGNSLPSTFRHKFVATPTIHHNNSTNPEGVFASPLRPSVHCAQRKFTSDVHFWEFHLYQTWHYLQISRCVISQILSPAVLTRKILGEWIEIC